MIDDRRYDVVIIGGGIAGLSAALQLPEHTRVALFTKGLLGESNTRYAQGGIAAALGADDSPELHYQDTIAAGAGLCDEQAVRVLVEQAPSAVRWLIELGVQFDRAQPESDTPATPDGFLLGREGAHCRWRVLHAGGDATGAEIERVLVAQVQKRPFVTLYEETFVKRLLIQHDICVGIEAVEKDGLSFTVEAESTILANGGAGGLWAHTSNPSGATADGLALAWHAGAALTDLEFMQFHPTVLMVDGTSHLISEAVRGEGAYLRNHAGERFMPRYSSQAELAPRDIVARAILSEMLNEHTNWQYLDLRHLPSRKMHARFPSISAFCRQHGLDLARDLLPIAPAAHYFMGGVMVDMHGRTTLPGLYAVGEVACTGVHGANRLASNSLLEGLVYGIRVADELAARDAVYSRKRKHIPQKNVSLITHTGGQECMLSSGSADEQMLREIRRKLQQLMWQHVSLCREQNGLLEAQHQIQVLQHTLLPVNEGQTRAPYAVETANMLLIAQLVVAAALRRCESRGGHWRLDYQASNEDLTHFVFQRNAYPYEKVSSREEVGAHA